ncbi:MAG TPA: phosphoadenylyl-sulfate reductase [Methylomirabilota bacterium]|nr:phosphoadenylyl-sulfate reductase [Methylomirabilota bacterium]
MLQQALSRLFPADSVAREDGFLEGLNAAFSELTAPERVEYALEMLPGTHMLSSSFGAQAAVMLHMVTRARPRIPVVLIDTGYLFAETYQFVDQLTERLQLNLKVFRSDVSGAWQETRFGKLWQQGLRGINQYNQLNKRRPMDQALKELAVGTWFSGLRRQQSASRAAVPPIALQSGRFKVHPIYDWTDRDVGRYLRQHSLPYHPLWEKGFLSIGDWHTTRSLAEAGSVEGMRFFGIKRECGLHEE